MGKNNRSTAAEELQIDKAFDADLYLKASRGAGLPAALWRLPGTDTVHFITDLSGHAATLVPELETMDKGFIIAPFVQDEGGSCRYIRADLHISSDDNAVHHAPTGVQQEEEKEKLDLWHTYVRQPDQIPAEKQQPDSQSNLPAPTGKEAFCQLVADSVEEIRRGTFLKVVPSRAKPTDLPEQFDVVETFMKLCKAYPNAFVSYVYLPGEGRYMGATPELLLGTEGNTFRTIALAGTQPYDEDVHLSDVLWSQKEIEEQALVSRYIINCFKKIRLREFQEKGPRTSRAGNLIHLKTEFIVDMEATGFPQLGTVMLKLLHPTSAVCGMPKEAAMDFLLQKEGYNRGYFSGYLGPVNMEPGTHLFVNLRCMQLFGNKAVLYAGAGVTEDSRPEKEWLETEHKTRTLLNIIES